jgi:hypothetical protein
MKWRYSTHLFASLGDFWLARGDPSQARECANQCLELATRTTSRKYLVRGWRLAGEIALAQRRWEEAEQALRHALTFAETIGNPTQLWKTHVVLGLFAEAKRPEAAQRGQAGDRARQRQPHASQAPGRPGECPVRAAGLPARPTRLTDRRRAPARVAPELGDRNLRS